MKIQTFTRFLRYLTFLMNKNLTFEQELPEIKAKLALWKYYETQFLKEISKNHLIHEYFTKEVQQI